MKTLLLALLMSAPNNFEVISVEDAAIRVAMYKICVVHYSISDPSSVIKLNWYTDFLNQLLAAVKSINTNEAYQRVDEYSELILHQVVHSPKFTIVGRYCDGIYNETHITV